MLNPLKEACPNCQSAEQLGKDTDNCLMCADPRTGVTRGWVWRWCWLHRKLVVEKNVARLKASIKASAAAVAEKPCAHGSHVWSEPFKVEYTVHPHCLRCGTPKPETKP